MIDLKRVKEYTELGFTKEEALDMVKQEELEAKEEAKNSKEKSDNEVEELKAEIESLKKEKKDKEKATESFKNDENEEKPIDYKEAFKNIFG